MTTFAPSRADERVLPALADHARHSVGALDRDVRLRLTVNSQPAPAPPTSEAAAQLDLLIISADEGS